MAAGGAPVTAVIVDDHAAIVAGVRSWCEQAQAPIRLVDVWTGPGADADVVLFDLELVPEHRGADRREAAHHHEDGRHEPNG